VFFFFFFFQIINIYSNDSQIYNLQFCEMIGKFNFGQFSTGNDTFLRLHFLHNIGRDNWETTARQKPNGAVRGDVTLSRCADGKSAFWRTEKESPCPAGKYSYGLTDTYT